MLEIVIVIVILALMFDVSNGWNDSANAIATVVSTRVLTPLQAVILAAVMNLLGAFAFTAVAKTIGKGIVNPKDIITAVIVATLVASFAWNSLMTVMGLPVSASHALIGSLMGAAIAYGGVDILNFGGLEKIFIALLISPVLGLIIGYIFMKLILHFFGSHPPGPLNRVFGKLQLASAGVMAFSHGSNDAQKAMGIITMTLVSAGYLNTVEVPFWVILACGLAMAVGTAMGGWRVIKTLGTKMLKLEPVHGFAAETAAASLIFGASHFGLPVSTTHVISSTIMGVGATKRLTAVRWGIAGKIVMAWVFTLPACGVLAWAVCKAMLPLFT